MIFTGELPTSIRISAWLKRVQEHGSRVNVRAGGAGDVRVPGGGHRATRARQLPLRTTPPSQPVLHINHFGIHKLCIYCI